MSEHKKVINVTMKPIAESVQATACNININHYNFDKVSEDFLESNETYKGYAIAPVKVDLHNCRSFELETVWTSRFDQMKDWPFVFGGRYSSYGWPHLFQNGRGSGAFHIRIPKTDKTYFWDGNIDTGAISIVPNRRYHFWFGQQDGDFDVYIKDQQGNIIGAKENLFIYQNNSTSGGYYGIDTGITVSPDLRIETKFKYDTSSSWRRLFGRTVDTSGINDVSLDFSHDGSNFYYSADDNQGNFRSITSFNTNVNTLVMDVKNNKIVLNGTEYAMNHSITKESSKTMGLFNCKYNDYSNIQDSSCFYGRVYYWRAYKNDVLVANFIPVYANMKIGNITVTTPCFYNTVSGTLKTNLNSSYGFTFNYDAFPDFLFYLDASWSDYNESTGDWDQWNTRRRVWSWSPKNMDSIETSNVRTRSVDPILFMTGWGLSGSYFNRGSLGLKDTKLTINGQVVWQAYKEFAVGDEVYLNHGMAQSIYPYLVNHQIDCYKTPYTWKGVIESITTDNDGTEVLTVAPMPNATLEKTINVNVNDATITSYGEIGKIDSEVTINTDQASEIKTETILDNYGMGGYNDISLLTVKPVEGHSIRVHVDGKEVIPSEDHVYYKRGSVVSLAVINNSTGRIAYSLNEIQASHRWFSPIYIYFRVYEENESGSYVLSNNYKIYVNDELLERFVGYQGQVFDFRIEKDGYQTARGTTTIPSSRDNSSYKLREDTSYYFTYTVYLLKLKNVEVRGTVEGANVSLFNGREHLENNDTIDYIKGTKILDGDYLNEANCYENGNYYYNVADPVPPVKEPARITYTSSVSALAGKKYYAYNHDNNFIYSDSNIICGVVGTLTNNNNVYSGFSDNDYLKIKNFFNKDTKSFEIIVKATLEGYSSNSGLIDSDLKTGQNIRFTITDTGYAHLRINSDLNSNTYKVDLTSSVQSELNQAYYYKATYNSETGYTLSISTDKVNWTGLVTSSELSAPLYSDSCFWLMGDNAASSFSLNGSIDLNECSFKINNIDMTQYIFSKFYDNSFIELDPQPEITKISNNSFYINDNFYLRSPNNDLINWQEESGESGEIIMETPFTLVTEKELLDSKLLPSLVYNSFDEDYIHKFLYWTYNNEKILDGDRVIDGLILSAKWSIKAYDTKETWESYYPFTDHNVAQYLDQLDPTKFAVNSSMGAITNVDHTVNTNYTVNDSFEINPDYNCTFQIDVKFNGADYHYGRVRIDESPFVPSTWDFNAGGNRNDTNVTTITKDLIAGKTYYVHLQWQVTNYTYGPSYGESLSITRIAFIVKDTWLHNRLIPDFYQSSYPNGYDYPISGYHLSASYADPSSSTSSSGELIRALTDNQINQDGTLLNHRWATASVSKPYAGQIFSENTIFKVKYYTINKYGDENDWTATGWKVYVSADEIDFTDSNWRNNCALIDTRVNQLRGDESQESIKYYEIPDSNKNVLARSIIVEITSNAGNGTYTSIGQMRFYGDFITDTGIKTVTYTSEIPAGVGEKYEAYVYEEELGE